jgi:hypothetical protein
MAGPDRLSLVRQAERLFDMALYLKRIGGRRENTR